MGNSIRRALALMLCLALTLGLGAGAMAGEMDLNGTEVTIWYMPLYEGFDERIAQDLSDKVRDEYGITLRTELLTFDAGPEKITVAMATGATPDILLDAYSRIAPAVDAGLLAEMDQLAAAMEGKLQDGIEAVCRPNGAFVYMPVGLSSGYNLCVNTTLAKRLGVYDLLPQDKLHWSYEDFLAFNRACAEKGADQGVYATQLFAGSKSSDSVYYSFIMSAGGDILNSEHTALAVDSEATRQALGLFKTLIDEKLVPDGAATTIDNGIRPNWYSQKLVYMTVSTGVGEVTKVRQQIDSGEIESFEVDIYELPTPDGQADPRVMSWGSTGMAVFKNGNDEKKIAAAQKVIEAFLTMEELNQEMWLNTGNPSVLKDLSVDYGDATVNEQAERAAAHTALYSDSAMGVLEGFWSDLRDAFYPQLQAYFVGEKTLEQMIADWTANGDAVIAKALGN